MHLWLMCHPSTCANEWRPKTSILCPFSLPRKTAQMVSPSYAQNKDQMDHPQIISLLLVAILNATCIMLQC